MKLKELKEINVGEIDLSKALKKPIKFFKWAISIIVLIAVIGGIVNGLLFLYEKDKLTKVIVEAELLKVGDERCDFQKPVYITLTNASEKTIVRTRYDIEVRKVGYSSDIAEHELKWPDTDKILLPKESANFCLALDLEYPYDEIYTFNPFDAKRSSLDGELEKYAKNYRERNAKALEDLILTGVVTSVEYK